MTDTLTSGSSEAALKQRIARLSTFLPQDPENDSLRQELFDCLLLAREFERALGIAQAGIRGDATRQAGWRYRKAVAARLNGQAIEAVSELRQLVEQGFQAPSLVIELARAEIDAGESDEAIHRLAAIEFLQLEPPLAEAALAVLMPALMARAELDRATQIGARYLAQRPHAAVVMGMQAAALLDAERLVDARALVEAGQKEGLFDANLAAAGGFVALDAGDPQLAKQRFDSALSAAPSLGRAHFGMGLVFAQNNELDASRRSFSTAVQTMPSHLGSWHALAWIDLLREDVDAAEASFLAALNQDRNFGDTHGGLGIVAALRGQRNAASEHVRTAKRLDRFSVNAGVAEAILEQPGDLRSPGTLARAFETFQRNVLARSPQMQASYARLVSHHLRAQPKH